MPKRWEVYPGKSQVLCSGRCISAKNLSVFYLTLALIVISSCLFLAFDCRLLAVTLSPSVPVLAAVQFIFVLCCLLRTTFSDPGIIPRGTPDEAAWIESQLEGPQVDRDGNYRPPVRLKDVQINGRVFKLKYCFTCKLWRPPRASHCSTCDNCVDRFDHHCPWVGNCVGRRNYRYFYLFLISLSVYCLYVMVFGIVNLVLLSNMRKDFLMAMKESPTSVLTILVAFFSIWSVVGLGGFHTMLICRETSTNEDIKGSFNQRRHPDLINPFDQGNGLANCCYVLFGPVTPSLLNFREDEIGLGSSISLVTNNGRNGTVSAAAASTAVTATPAVRYSNLTRNNNDATSNSVGHVNNSVQVISESLPAQLPGDGNDVIVKNGNGAPADGVISGGTDAVGAQNSNTQSASSVHCIV
ncbi:hypothetical protein BOX15_Mlig030425g2 [Macrostomum lignano]|uniref:Palmitoyltransferase n=1 Tax=Macrostomum lignano TaxID=282301 RepID=A0A267EHQ4_9PLAT|nr:hypothetical protein BOX15_Mlig030425g2 [Macrostomum lignano]